MCNADRALGLIDVLTAGTGGTVGVDFEVIGIKLEIDLLDLGQDSDRRSRSVYPAAGLRDRDALDAELLSPEERAWLNAYHRRVREQIAPLVDEETREWLAGAAAEI